MASWGDGTWKTERTSALANFNIPACKFHSWIAAFKDRTGRNMCAQCGEIKEFHIRDEESVKPYQPIQGKPESHGLVRKEIMAPNAYVRESEEWDAQEPF